jgi:hypothetical protein
MKLFAGISPKILFVSLSLCAQSLPAADIDVMSQNQYLGADLAPVVTAIASGDLVGMNNAVTAALKGVAATRTADRMAALAALIAKRQPALVGLQEVFAFGCLDPYGTGACTDPSVAGAFEDHLALTLAALDGSYKTAATVVNLNIPFPGMPFDLYGYGIPAYLTVMDRDVILSRSDIETTPVDFGCAKIAADGCNYGIALPAGPFTVERGYVGVDATVNGSDYRIVNTHLEVKDPPVPAIFQVFQAQELIGRLSATPADKTLIVLGDINSSPVESLPLPYAQFIASGYSDALQLRPGNAPEFTCCQLENLMNKVSLLHERIDMIFSRELPGKVQQARVLGGVVSSKTNPPGLGLWASDHGSVAARIEYY